MFIVASGLKLLPMYIVAVILWTPPHSVFSIQCEAGCCSIGVQEEEEEERESVPSRIRCLLVCLSSFVYVGYLGVGF